MKSFGQAYATLRKKNRKNYFLLVGCCFVSVLLITSFAVIMQSGTVQETLPVGGDSRKQMDMIFAMAGMGCAVFTAYASSLFFRAKSREMGVFMALGAGRKKLAGLLYRDLALVAAGSALAGMLLATPLATGLWGLLRLLVVDTPEMAFVPGWGGYLWGLAFSAFTALVLFVTGFRFVRRTNIIDVVNEQRKSEPIREVKNWYGWGGLLLMAAGGLGGYLLPRLLFSLNRVPTFWPNLLYLLMAAGLYLFLVFIVVRGRGGKSYYKNIITRSMMRFQGRQTVLNMCVIAILLGGAYFAMFYVPSSVTTSLLSISARPVDYVFSYRAADDMVTRQDIYRLAQEEGVEITDYNEISYSVLATDGWVREWQEDGSITRDHFPYLGEGRVINESGFNAASGLGVDVRPGGYILGDAPDVNDSPYDYYEEVTKITNPDTKQALDVTFQRRVEYEPLLYWYVLDDADYAAVTRGLGAAWEEGMVLFNVADADASYGFAKRLENEIIDQSGPASAVLDNYDRIEKQNAEAAGEGYSGDAPEYRLNYADRGSADFNLYWKYNPRFRVLDSNELIINLAVFLMLFVFIAVICFAAVLVIGYTRCLTIALNNTRIYEDLRRLGANNRYLYRSVRAQVRSVFMVPAIIGSSAIFLLYAMILYFNSAGFTGGELAALGVDLLLLAALSLVLWAFYRFTLGRVCRMLGVGRSKKQTGVQHKNTRAGAF